MINSRFSQNDLLRAAEIVAIRTGLHFSEERLKDMERGILSAASELGFSTPGACFDWLLSDSMSQKDIEILANFLTIGETFFYRDTKCFDAFREKILPELINLKSGERKDIRIWSAGCCTGEEPYTIAIILREVMHEISSWNINIRATDINSRFLKKAVDGVYSDWSFRDTPSHFRAHYFRSTGARYYELLPEIRNMVDFSMLNLVDNIYPSVINNTNAMDVVFCRNVLMYFTAEQAVIVTKRLYNSISDNGYLIVSPSETSQVLFSQFEPVNINGLIFYKKSTASRLIANSDKNELQSAIYESIMTSDERSRKSHFETNPDLPLAGRDSPEITETDIREEDEGAILQPEKEYDSMSFALSLFRAGNYRETVKILLQYVEQEMNSAPGMILLSRAFANLGEFDDARRWCEKAINKEKLNAEYYHLLSVILIEQNERSLAEKYLHKALYSDPDYALAHFTLGILEKSQGRYEEAYRHFNNTLMILSRQLPDELIPGSDGMTAGSLAEIVRIFTTSRENYEIHRNH